MEKKKLQVGMLDIKSIETSEGDAGWEEAIGICHYKAISDITGSHPVEKSRPRKAWCHCGLKKAWRLWAVRRA